MAEAFGDQFEARCDDVANVGLLRLERPASIAGMFDGLPRFAVATVKQGIGGSHPRRITFRCTGDSHQRIERRFGVCPG